MQIRKRIERLENSLNESVKWNLERLTEDELLELRWLKPSDEAKAWAMLQKYIDEGKVSYEYIQSN